MSDWGCGERGGEVVVVVKTALNKILAVAEYFYELRKNARRATKSILMCRFLSFAGSGQQRALVSLLLLSPLPPWWCRLNLKRRGALNKWSIKYSATVSACWWSSCSSGAWRAVTAAAAKGAMRTLKWRSPTSLFLGAGGCERTSVFRGGKKQDSLPSTD